jgi:hypothetical protein
VLKNLNLQPCDTIVIDGLPMPPAKSGEDGRYHMLGDLQLAPTSVFKTNLRQIDSLLERGGAMVVILVPLPRYVRNSCCDDSEHVTNQGEKDFYEKFLGAEKRLLDAAAAGGRTGGARVIDLCKLFGSAETPFQELSGHRYGQATVCISHRLPTE